MMQVGLGNYQFRNSNVMEKVDNKTAENKPEGKYADVSTYYAYLKDKYPCLTASDYKVTISPAYLEKCIKNPEEAELLERGLEQLPVNHQSMTATWKALGARVVNEQWIFDENGNCGGSPSMYVTNQSSSASSSNRDKISEKKNQRKKPLSQEHYEKRKLLREQFEERLAKKEYLKEQIKEKEIKEDLLKESVLLRRQNIDRLIERYEANILGQSDCHMPAVDNGSRNGFRTGTAGKEGEGEA